MRLGRVVIALLSMLSANDSLGQERQPLRVIVQVEDYGGAKSAVVAYGDFEYEIGLGDARVGTTISPADLSDLPMSFTVEWADQHTTSLPALWLGSTSGQRLRIRLYRSNFKAADHEAADLLCLHTPIDNPGAAYRALFGCQEWTLLMEREDPRWTVAHLRGLNGWLKGAYYLFATQRASGGIGLGHWGIQPELLSRLSDVLMAVKSGRRSVDSFKPLRIEDVERALVEARNWELKLNRRIPGLVGEQRLAEARQVAQRVLDAYERAIQSLPIAERGEDTVIDGLRRSDIVRQIADIDAGLLAAGLAQKP